MKLYCLEVLNYNSKQDKAYWKQLSFSHDIDKLCNSVYLDKNWLVGTNDVTNDKEQRVKMHTKEDVCPQYFIREVNFIV